MTNLKNYVAEAKKRFNANVDQEARIINGIEFNTKKERALQLKWQQGYNYALKVVAADLKYYGVITEDQYNEILGNK